MKKYFLIIVSIVIIGNCFGQAPNWQWAKSTGGTLQDYGYSVSTDASGNVFMTGFFQSTTITFGTTILTNSSSNHSDIFLVKYDALGNVLWAKSAVGTSDDEGNSVSTDASGNVFMTGYFYSPSITFGAITLFNSFSSGAHNDIFIVKYDSLGNVLWAKSATGASSYDEGKSVSTDTSGNVFLTGNFSSPTITFGTTTLTHASGNNYDVFIVKYDASGNVLWAKSAGGTSNDEGYSVSTDASGNVFITGYFISPTIAFGTIALTNAGNDDIFIVKYDAAGNVVWAKSEGGYSDDVGKSVSTDASGNVFMTGYFQDTSIVFGTDTLTNAGNTDIFIVKYDATGNVLWAKSAGWKASDYGYSVSTDASGNVFMTGSYIGSITFGTTTLISTAGSLEIFIVKYAAAGNVLWAKSAGGTSNDFGQSVSTDASGNVFITGYFDSPSISCGTTALTNSGFYDIFIAKIDSVQFTVSNNELINNENGITISPNPFTSQTTITFNEDASTSSATHTIKITDVLGEEIKTIHFTGKQCVIEKGEMKAGIYFVEITDGSTSSPTEQNNSCNLKMVIQ